MNRQAPIIDTEFARADPALCFGLGRTAPLGRPEHRHQPEFDSIVYVGDATLERERFAEFADRLTGRVYRAKGFVKFADGSCLFNFVSGRWDLECFSSDNTALVFIGSGMRRLESALFAELERCRA